AWRPGDPRPGLHRRLGAAASHAPPVSPGDGGQPGARVPLPARSTQDPRGERRAAEPRAPPGDRERLLPDGAGTPGRARPLAAPPRDRPPLRAGGERPPRRPRAARAGHARRRAISPPPPRPLRRLAPGAGRLQRGRAPGRPRARPRSRSVVVLAPRRARLPPAHEPGVRAPLLRRAPRGRGAGARRGRRRAVGPGPYLRHRRRREAARPDLIRSRRRRGEPRAARFEAVAPPRSSPPWGRRACATRPPGGNAGWAPGSAPGPSGG